MDRIAAIKAGARFPPSPLQRLQRRSQTEEITQEPLSLLAAPELFRDCVRRERTRGGEFMLISPCLSSRARPFLGGENPCGRIGKHAESGADGDTKHRS